MTGKKPTLWEVLESYADVRDELDDVLSSFSLLQFELESAMDDISDELEAIQEHLSECDMVFRRYKYREQRGVFMPVKAEENNSEEELPFMM